jgi:hypothetical protein
MSILACVFAGAMLSNTAFLSRNAVAGLGEARQTQADRTQRPIRLAQATLPDANAVLDALIKEDEQNRAKSKGASGTPGAPIGKA